MLRGRDETAGRFARMPGWLAVGCLVLGLSGCGPDPLERLVLAQISAANETFAEELARAEAAYAVWLEQEEAPPELLPAPADADSGPAAEADHDAEAAAAEAETHAAEGEIHTAEGETHAASGAHGEPAGGHGPVEPTRAPSAMTPLEHYRAALAGHEAFLERHRAYEAAYREEPENSRAMKRVLGAILAEQAMVRRQYGFLQALLAHPTTADEQAAAYRTFAPPWLDTVR